MKQVDTLYYISIRYHKFQQYETKSYKYCMIENIVPMKLDDVVNNTITLLQLYCCCSKPIELDIVTIQSHHIKLKAPTLENSNMYWHR